MAEGVVPPPPWEEEAKKKGIPPPPWEAPESTFSRIEQLKAKAPKGEVARKARTHLTNIGMAQSAATQEQEEKNAYARAAGQAAEMLPFAAAAPFTGGVSLAAGGGLVGATAAAGLMGAAGLAGGLARIGVKSKMGSSEIPQTPKQVAAELGVDVATGMLGEATGRGIGKIFKEIIPKLVVRSAAKDQLGRTLLTQSFDQTRQQLSQATSNMHVDVTSSYLKFFDEMGTLPKGMGKLGKRLTQLTEKEQAIFSDVAKDLNVAQGTVSNLQPLDALVEMRGRLNQIAWDKDVLTPRGQAILQRFADNLDNDIKAGLKGAGPEAEALYAKANAIWKIQKRQEIGTKVVEDALQRMTTRGVYAGTAGAAGGGYAGYRRGGVAGAAKGALEGAVAGAAIGASTAAPPKISAWVLERLMAHPQASVQIKKAIDFYAKGESANAAAAASRAVTLAKIRNDIKEAIRHPEVIAPTVPPQ